MAFETGYPKQLCPNVSSSLCCGICKNILNNPMQSGECGHRFCHGCIESEKERNLAFVCPSCTNEGDTTNIDLSADEIFMDRGVVRELSRLQVLCIYCKKEMELKLWKDSHFMRCASRPMPCSFGCGEEISPNDVPKHQLTCPRREIQCDKCSMKFKFAEKEIHETRECESLFDKCEYCQERVLSSEIEHHKEHECSVSWKNSCPYGCTNVPNENLLVHREENVVTHLDRLLANVKSGDQGNGSSAGGEVITEFAKIAVVCHGLDERLKSQENIISQMARTIQEQELQMCALRDELQILKSSNYDGTLVWRIDGFRDKQKAAKDGIQPSIFSPSFFTSRSGYQMCARLYLNGDGLGQGTHLSLFFVLMRGPYDPLLKWPFQQKVTFLLKDQKGRADVVDAFRPDPSGESFKRPTTMMNIASGSPRFLPLSDVEDANKGYVIDDVMFIRVIVDCSTLVS